MSDPDQTPEPNSTPAPTPAEDLETYSPPLLQAEQIEDGDPQPNVTDDSDLPVYVLPTEEQLSEADAAVRGLIPLTGIGREELQKMYENRIAQVGPEKFLIQAAVSGSYENLLWSSLNNYSSEAERILTAIENIQDKSKFANKLTKDGKVILSSTNFREKKPGETKMVSGEAGMVEMLGARKGQIRRVPLYNSGFSIDLRNPNNDDLASLMRRARADLDEYGREFGSHFYIYSDLILKRTVFDALLNMVIGSSLRDWKKPGVLAQHLKLPDYDVILTSLVSLMYPTGYPDFRHTCTRPSDSDHPTGCSHVTSVTADSAQLILTNFSALNDDAVTHMVRSRLDPTPILAKDLTAYHKTLGFEDTVVTFGEYQFTMTVPSMADYFLAGEAFNADLLNEISANNRKEIYDAISFREGRLYLPWIKQMASVDENGATGLLTKDKSVISFMLDTLMTEDKEKVLVKSFIDFINTAKLSLICYPTFACESCGYTPPSKTGFLTVDPQHAFFIQSMQKLTRR